MKSVLHVGCGYKNITSMGPAFNDGTWEEVRFDVDKEVNPDILGSMLEMSAVEDESVDAIWSSHNIEHVFTHQVPIVLSEFVRVLRKDGFVIVSCPDIKEVCRRVALGDVTDILYVSRSGPITPLDVLFGHIRSVEQGNVYMAHKTGFTLASLGRAFGQAGFAHFNGFRRTVHFDLWMIGFKSIVSKSQSWAMLSDHTGIDFEETGL